jgi:hypothetical protein
VDVDYSVDPVPMRYDDDAELAFADNPEGARTSDRTGRPSGRMPAAPVRRTTHVEPNDDNK